MDSVYRKIIEKISSYIVIKDINGNIIFKNNNIALELVNNNFNNSNELLYKNKIYNVEYLSFDNYQIEIYNDITKYKEKINELKHDYLTGLYNRFAIIEEIEKLNPTNYTLIIGDIDHFKKINDNYGHLVGDFVLKGISEILLKSIKNIGFVGRYGGEEFLIVIPKLETEESYNIIEKIRKLIEKTKIKVKYNDCIKEFYVSMTFGLTINNLNKNINELIDEADKALYIGKNNGRNQTNIYKKNEV